MNTSESLQQILIDKITQSPDKKITFAEYMDLVLYHPQYGYYSSESLKIGSQGDFFTSSSLGSDFGELLAKQFLEMREILGKTSPFYLVEMGAGLGLLAGDVLNYIQENYPDFLDSLEYIIIEQSASLIQKQQKGLQKYLDKSIKICWRNWQEIPDHSLIGCLFSNELVDAFPVHRIALQTGKLQEIYVTYTDNKLQEIIAESSTDELLKYFTQVGIEFPSDAYPENYQTEVNLSALSWLETVAQKLQRGYLLTIDYGYPAPKYYHPQRYQGTLKCYYNHHHHDNPYINMGTQDITAHIDFTALERYGEQQGLELLGLTKQGLFLMSLGLGEKLTELSTGKYNITQIFHRRDALHQLIDPTGLGGFGVLLQCKGLSPLEKERSLLGLKHSI